MSKQTNNESKELKVLILEDSPRDLELMREQLSSAGYRLDLTHVENEAGYTASLRKNCFDLIISDFKLPGFDAFRALEISLELCPETPFICISGTIGEETAVELIKLGAVDYVSKDKPESLPMAVKRALEEAEVKAEYQKTTEALRQSEEKLRSIYSVAPAGIGVVSNRVLKEVNPRVCEMTGYTREELIDKNARILYPSREEYEFVGKEKYDQIREKGTGSMETRWQKKDGSIINVLLASTPIELNDHSIGVTFTALDITERKQSEEKLKTEHDRLSFLMKVTSTHFNILDAECNILDVDLNWQKIYGDFRGRKCHEYFMGRKKPCPGCGVPKALKTKEIVVAEEFLPTENKIFQVHTIPFQNEQGEWLCAEFNIDITERKQTEQLLRESEKQSAFLAQTAFELVELTSIQEIYKYTVQKLYELFEGNSIVSLVEYNYNENRWKMQQIKGVGKKTADLSRLLGFDIKNLEGDISTKYYEQISSGKVEELDFDFPNLFNNKLSAAIGSAVKKMFAIEKMYCIAYEQDEQILGNITFTTHKKTEPINTKLIESFVQQVSTFVKKQKAEKRLKESEEKFRRLAENTSDVIAIMDMQGTITYMSRMIENETGYTKVEVEGTNIQKLLTPESYNVTMNRIHKRLKGENINAPYEVGIVTKTGKVIPFELNTSAITENGELKGIQIVARDITERKQAEKIRQLQYNIAHASITTRNLNELFDSVKNELNNVIDAKNFVIAFYNEETGMLCANVDRDEKDEIPEWPAEKSLTGYVIKQNRSVLLQKNEILSLYEKGIIELHGTVSEAWLGVPLRVEGKMLGAVVVQNYDNPDVYDQSSIEIMELVAHELSMFIDRQRSEEIANKLSRAVEQSSVSVMITNREGAIEYVNPFFTELTGYSFEEAKGENSNILQSGHQSKAFYKELWDTILSGSNWEGEILNKKKTGELYWEKAVISPIVSSEGAITNFVAIKEDITERKKMLEDLIAAKEKAQESDKLKTAFLNNISHEIRTPLNGILGFGALLSETDPGPEEKKEMLAIVQQSSKRLMKTMMDYMDMARIVSGTMEVHKSEFLLQPFFEEVIEETRQLSAAKKIGFETDCQIKADVSLDSDPELIRKTLHILLDNALKFTDKGGIRCGYKPKESFVEFFVQDTGKGIDPEKLDAIFGMFTQENPSDTRAHEGSGLGLSIANGLVKLLGGTIAVTSEKGKGSTFTFTVPCTETVFTEKAPPKEEKNTAVEGKPLVLLAEDEESNYLYMEVVLKKAGFDYLLAKDGKEAVALCKQHPDITLVLMDIKMPVMNGLEATKRIREFRPELPIIATTAYAQTGDEQRFLTAGCDGYLPKPIKKDKLLELFQKYLKS